MSMYAPMQPTSVDPNVIRSRVTHHAVNVANGMYSQGMMNNAELNYLNRSIQSGALEELVRIYATPVQRPDHIGNVTVGIIHRDDNAIIQDVSNILRNLLNTARNTTTAPVMAQSIPPMTQYGNQMCYPNNTGMIQPTVNYNPHMAHNQGTTHIPSMIGAQPMMSYGATPLSELYSGNASTPGSAGMIQPTARQEVRSNPGSTVEIVSPPAPRPNNTDASLATNCNDFTQVIGPLTTEPSSPKAAPKRVTYDDINLNVPEVLPEFILKNITNITDELGVKKNKDELTMEGVQTCKDFQVYRTPNGLLSTSVLELDNVYKSWEDCKIDLYSSTLTPKNSDYPAYMNLITYRRYMVLNDEFDACETFMKSLYGAKHAQTSVGDIGGFFSVLGDIEDERRPGAILRNTLIKLFIDTLNDLISVQLAHDTTITIDDITDFKDLCALVSTGNIDFPPKMERKGAEIYLSCVRAAMDKICPDRGINWYNINSDDDCRKVLRRVNCGVRHAGMDGLDLINHIGDGAIPIDVRKQLKRRFVIHFTESRLHTNIPPSNNLLKASIGKAYQANPLTSIFDVVMSNMLKMYDNATSILLDGINIPDIEIGKNEVYSLGTNLYDIFTSTRRIVK